ncbi:hypothetical protein IAU60_004696 [Kwoniella sp. DSM 27419]
MPKLPALPLVRLPPNAVVHKFGTPTSAARSSGLLRFGDKGWTINAQTAAGGPKSEGWAIVGDAEGRRLAVETLLSRHRILPLSPPPGPFPRSASVNQPSSAGGDPLSALSTYKPIRHLAFARPPTTGEFTDFTARYGALLEEDKLSFRETLAALDPPPSTSEVDRVSRLMKVDRLLDLPSVSLSSGQTRRARIASALLTKPLLLILEDPMAGLDIPSRKEVSDILGDLNANGGIRIVLVLRAKGTEGLPDWVTDIAEVRSGEVWIGKRDEYERSLSERSATAGATANINEVEGVPEAVANGKPVVKLDGVSVSYGEGTRQVLKNVSWTIRPGEKWHLKGANGSGKTTLLSLVLGHHPRSFSLPPASLELFGKARRSTPTPILRKMIGHTSPEIYASFPRGMGLTAFSAIGTGFEGVFSRREMSTEQKDRVLALLDQVKDLLLPAQSTMRSQEVNLRDIALREFSHFTPAQQGLLLFLRAIVSRPRLLILDEPSQGVDESIWERCKGLLEKEWASEEGKAMAVIVVSHYEDEVPWAAGRGRVLQLDQGVATTH